MGPAADGRIIEGANGRLVGIDHLQPSDAPFFQLAPHDPGQRADAGFIDIRDPEAAAVQLVAGSHGADDRRAGLISAHHQRQLGRHGVHGINHIIIGVEREAFDVFRQYKALVDSHFGVRIDFKDPLPHHLDLIPPDGFTGRDNLAVQIGQTDLIVVDQIKGADAAARQRLAHIAAHAPDTENGHAGPGQAIHGGLAKEQLGSRKLVHHSFSPHPVLYGGRGAAPLPPGQGRKLHRTGPPGIVSKHRQ